MNANVLKFIGKAAPIIKKAGPIVFATAGSALGAIADQKNAAQMEDMMNRIVELEKLVKK